MSYHNTTQTLGPDLLKYEVQAVSQEDAIMWYMELGGPGLTPSEIQAAIFERTPITSVRRALSNLTANGDLVKTEEQRPGPYGRPEFVWELAPKHRQLNLL